MNDVTQLLGKMGSGDDPHVAEELLKLVYRELHQMAEAKMRGQRPGHTLQATILVDDAWLKLFPDGQNPKFEGRKHFFGAASQVMRRELVDHARRRKAQKRGGRVEMSKTQLVNVACKATDDLTLAVDEALTAFSRTQESTARLVELRFYIGLSMERAAEVLGIPLRTAQRDFKYFKAWFLRQYGNEINI